MGNELKLAVLIDADNISDKYVKIILDETAKSGVATYKRIYGDWTNPRLVSWKNVLLDNSISPIQQYSYTTGKNATDSAMIIDAMDILYSGTVDGFCIASSDSDFTRLVARLRESGMYVTGMGKAKRRNRLFPHATNLNISIFFYPISRMRKMPPGKRKLRRSKQYRKRPGSRGGKSGGFAVEKVQRGIAATDGSENDKKSDHFSGGGMFGRR